MKSLPRIQPEILRDRTHLVEERNLGGVEQVVRILLELGLLVAALIDRRTKAGVYVRHAPGVFRVQGIAADGHDSRMQEISLGIIRPQILRVVADTEIAAGLLSRRPSEKRAEAVTRPSRAKCAT